MALDSCGYVCMPHHILWKKVESEKYCILLFQDGFFGPRDLYAKSIQGTGSLIDG